MKLCELRKKPYTMAELYKIVEEKLKKDGNWPDDIIDYALVDNQCCSTGTVRLMRGNIP